MKIVYLLCFILCFTSLSFGQLISNAPWMSQFSEQDIKTNNIRFQEIIDAFNSYWETRDPMVKGSGYKPFKRWENYWSSFVDQDGYLPTKSFLWQTLQDKYQISRSRTSKATSNWYPMGPFWHTNTGSWSSGQGRVNVVVVDPNNPNTYYVGAPAGGIWKSTDAGQTWIPLSDQLGQIGVSGIAIDYSNSDTIYIATGDDDAGDTSSIGVWKSTDAGVTWNETGLNPSNSPNKLTDLNINPNNSNMLWVASEGGIYKSVDGGLTWDNKHSGSFTALDVKPGDPNVVYAATPSKFYKSTDAGDTFIQITAGLPTVASRIAMDVTPANPEVVYLLVANPSSGFKGVYRSNDSGQSFFQTAQTADIFESPQAWYDLAIAVSDTDENMVFSGCLNIWKSTNGGESFSKLNSWNAPNQATYTHADIHYIQFFGNQVFVGSDGGFYKSSDDGTNFTDLTKGLQIGQFYRIAVSKTDSNKMVGGLQDNGGYAFSDTTWKNYYGADGMDTAIHPQNSNHYYGFIQSGGNLYISENAGNSNTMTIPAPTGESGNWVTPLEMNKDGELYAGYKKLYKLTGNSFQPISQNFNSIIDYLELDPIDSDIIYVAINNVLNKSTNHGQSFTSSANFNSNISSIEVNNEDNTIVYLSTAGTDGKVFKSVDGGYNFTDITGNLPSVTKNIIKHRAEDVNNSIYLGTSLGVFSFDDQTQTWEAFDTNLPNVSVSDLDINVSDANITASTYGRGVWRSALPSISSPPTDIKLIKINAPQLNELNCGTSIIPQIEIFNNGSNAIPNFDLIYSFDGGTPVTVPVNYNFPSGSTWTVDLPSHNLATGSHSLSVEVNASGDAFSSNNLQSTNFLMNKVGAVDVVNSFENDDQNLLESNAEQANFLWERGEPMGALLNQSSFGGTKAYGTNLDGNYSDNVKAFLVSECYDLTTISNPILIFEMAFDLESDYDILYVEYSTDMGVTWSLLGSANDPDWYNSSRLSGDGIADNCQLCVGGQWTNTESNLTSYRYDLTSFASESNFLFRFVFNSDWNTNNEGVVIDDLGIRSALSSREFENNQFLVYPNPTNDDIKIKLPQPSDFTCTISNIAGKVIFKSDYLSQTSHITVPLKNIAAGLYFVTIDFEDGKRVTKKLIKN